MKKCLLLSLLCAVLVFINRAGAQQQKFITYTVQDGLVANPVRVISQDNYGFIWIGTYQGLSRYDGYRFTNYTEPNTLSHNFVNAVQGLEGKLLIGENNGSIDVFDRGRLQQKIALGSAANSIMPYKKGLLISTDADGFYYYHDAQAVQPPQDRTGTALEHELVVNDSLLLSNGPDHDLFLFTLDLKYRFSLHQQGLHFTFLKQDKLKRVWAGTSEGLKLVQLPQKKGDTLSFVALPQRFNFFPLNASAVMAMVEEADGGSWVGTTKGLVHLSAQGVYELYTEKDGLPSVVINALFQDREGNLWIGTESGLAKWVATNSVMFYNGEKGAFKNDVDALRPVSANTVLLSTLHGLQRFSVADKSFKEVPTVQKSFATFFTDTIPLVFCGNQILIFDEQRNYLQLVKTLNRVVPEVYSACRDASGTFFLGTGKGLFVVTPLSTIPRQVLPHRITCLLADRGGAVWAGTWGNGLFRIESKAGDSISFDVKNFTSLIRQNQIRSLYQDRRQRIWVGTRYGGAFRLSPVTDSFQVRGFTQQNGLLSDWIKCFAETPAEDIWIGSYLGLDKLVKEGDNFRVFNFSNATNFFAEMKSLSSPDGKTWFAGANLGMAVFKDEALHRLPPPQAVILSAVLGTGENKIFISFPQEHYVLKHFQNAATFEFSAAAFINEKQVQYSYRLKGGGDTAWSPPQNQHQVSYASLKPGQYIFEVRTLGWNGKFGTPASFSFTIAAPFWQQPWFIAAGIFLLALFFYGLYQYRVRQLLRVQKVRNNIATDLHDAIGSTLTNISILSELTMKNMSSPQVAEGFLTRITEESAASQQALDDIIWSVNTANDNLVDTLARMRRYAAELFENSAARYILDFDTPGTETKLQMEQRRDLYLIYKEALNNVYKHANAKNVRVQINYNQHRIQMIISDDGKGFDTGRPTDRNGLKNLKMRTEKWKGKLSISSAPAEGTTVNLFMPIGR